MCLLEYKILQMYWTTVLNLTLLISSICKKPLWLKNVKRITTKFIEQHALISKCDYRAHTHIHSNVLTYAPTHAWRYTYKI